MSPTAGRVDVVVVGGGIVGLATARALLHDRPGLDLVLLEREDIAAHQSGHNSGVIHSGLYYKPGSAKARLCTTGRAEMEEYCSAVGIPWDRCGKVVVASLPDEVPALAALAERGRQNGLEVEELSAAGLAEHEPHAVGLASLFVPATGVVDYKVVCQRLATEIVELGGRILTGVGVTSAIDTGTNVVVRSDVGLWWADRAVTCAGAWSDVLAEAGGEKPKARIIPFRGEYLELTPEASHLVKHLIYPVPDARFPFLGVHFTRGIDGHVHAGPNAVPALGRDSYSWTRVRPIETATGGQVLAHGRRRDRALARALEDGRRPPAAGARREAGGPGARRRGCARPGDQPGRHAARRLRDRPQRTLRPRRERAVAGRHRRARHRRLDRPGGRARRA
jgi:L-2-hydroxyglutarate oxidase